MTTESAVAAEEEQPIDPPPKSTETSTTSTMEKTPTTDSEAQQTSRPSNQTPHNPGIPTLHGWRLTLLLLSLYLGLFLSFLDTTIVAVALPTIAAQFDDFSHSTWVLTAYLLTYMAFAIIISRFSDIFGKKTVEIGAFVAFIAFSLGCGLSRNMTELVVFRALQGIGGSGLFSMTIIIALNAVPPQKMGLTGALIGVVMVTSGVLGPILSGAITRNRTSDTWRWIFYLNIPVGGLALAMLLAAWPRDTTRKQTFSLKAAKTVDLLGCVLLLAGSVLLIFSLQEAGAFVFAWSSPTIVACLVVSGIAFVAFIAWQECLAAHSHWTVQLVFPVSVLRQRVLCAAILATLLAGFNFYIAVVNLPQRFQIVDADSPVIAGVKLLPMMVSSAVGSLVGGGINSRRNVTPYTLIASSTSQLLGYGLMTTLGNTSPTPDRQFGFQVFLGLGFGLAMPSVTIIAQLHSSPKWLSVTQGALTQVRSLGGSIGLAIGVIVFNSKIRHSAELDSALSPEQMSALLKSPLTIASLAPRQQILVSEVFADAFTQEMRVATYIAAVGFVVSLLTIQKNPPPVPQRRPPPSKEMKQNEQTKIPASDQ